VLVEMGADFNRAGRTFRVTPLHSAVASRSLAIVELLLQYGAAPDPTDPGGAPLHSAVMLGAGRAFLRVPLPCLRDVQNISEVTYV
jgi:ankyrin repeat protein